MGSNQYDHCRNCTHWQNSEPNQRKALCSLYEQDTGIRGWCGKHSIKDAYDYNDPSVIYNFNIEITLKSGSPKPNTKSVLEGIRLLGYTGPDDYYEPLRNYDKDFPKDSDYES